MQYIGHVDNNRLLQKKIIYRSVFPRAQDHTFCREKEVHANELQFQSSLPSIVNIILHNHPFSALTHTVLFISYIYVSRSSNNANIT